MALPGLPFIGDDGAGPSARGGAAPGRQAAPAATQQRQQPPGATGQTAVVGNQQRDKGRQTIGQKRGVDPLQAMQRQYQGGVDNVRAVVTQQPRAPPVPAPVVYPSGPTRTILTPAQQSERYGIESGAVSRALRLEMEEFERWQVEPINAERSARYARAVQTTTIDKQERTILSFLGYVGKYFPNKTAGLGRYAEPQIVAAFLGYIMARGVFKGHVLKHVSLARKVNDYLKSGARMGSDIRRHATEIDEWLATMEAQISANMTAAPPRKVPLARDMWRWVDHLVEGALVDVDHAMTSGIGFNIYTAEKVQRALIAALVTGRYIPPCRLSLIRSMNHPRYNGTCTDPDCRERGHCAGNQIQVLERQAGSGSETDSDHVSVVSALALKSDCMRQEHYECKGPALLRCNLTMTQRWSVFALAHQN